MPGSNLERDYQMEVINKIYRMFLPAQKLKDVLVIINDPNYIQGIPDLTILYRPTGRWGLLEVKLSEKSKEQPNQRWYVEHWGEAVFAAFIYPEVEEEVLRALQQSLAG